LSAKAFDQSNQLPRGQASKPVSTADCIPVTATPGISRLYADFCASAATGFLPSDENWFAHRPPTAAHWPELVSLLARQNPSLSAAAALESLANGAGTVLTGQQVTLFGGPLFTPFKAATALARARTATAAGHPHAAIFWLATEDHDFAEINHVTFPARRSLEKLVYSSVPQAPVPVGGVVIDDSITPLIDRAWELIGFSDAMEALAAAYQPGRTFAQAFADFYARIFAAQGLLIVDASGREFHRLGAPVLRAGIELADPLHAALLERNKALEAAGYHAQVAVGPQSSLLFLIDEATGARVALKRVAPTAAEPNGLWQAGRLSFSTNELVGILDAAPERISPSALLRPVFQDFIFGSSAQVGGPAEIAYLAQSAVLFQRIEIGGGVRQTPPLARFSGTLIEPAVGELLRRHELSHEFFSARLFHEDAPSLAKRLAARAMPIEAKRKLASAGNALDAELTPLLDWMHAQDEGLGRSADTAASKMRYQMNRLRNLAANFELQREASLTRHAEAIIQAVMPGGVMQERVHGAAFYFGRYGLDLAETLVTHAENPCPGHRVVWL
jgi:bacillithiol biosynthesis cysteine-adding enzyme BshC